MIFLQLIIFNFKKKKILKPDKKNIDQNIRQVDVAYIFYA